MNADVTIDRFQLISYPYHRASVALEPVDPALLYRPTGWYTCR
jgi:hypothetical protein